jgi:alpha-glucoside transport system substrate-binding protein
VAFSDRPEVEALMAHLATPGSVREWAEAGGFTSPQHNPGYDLPPVDRAVQELLDTATVVRPDASDSMPAAIGTSLLWSEITAWVADTQSYVDFAATMDAAVDDLG